MLAALLVLDFALAWSSTPCAARGAGRESVQAAERARARELDEPCAAALASTGLSVPARGAGLDRGVLAAAPKR